MRKLIGIIGLAALCGCTTITREATNIDGSKTTYIVKSWMNNKTIDGLKLKDCNGCVEFSLTDYKSNQDAALQVALAALQAYLATMK